MAPTTTLCGTPSEANKIIGGIPNIHYFNFASKGRGQVLRLLWEDAGIAYNDTRYPMDEYPQFKATQLKEWNPLATIPVVELNGRILTQSYAILRRFARQLNAYDGTNEEDKYFVDLICDAGSDWRSKFVDAAFGPNPDKDVPVHNATARPAFLKGLNEQLQRHDSARAGPYVIGQTITYADLVIYQICHDEGLTLNAYAGLKDYPRLAQLAAAVEQRPNVAAFLKSNRYLG